MVVTNERDSNSKRINHSLGFRVKNFETKSTIFTKSNQIKNIFQILLTIIKSRCCFKHFIRHCRLSSIQIHIKTHRNENAKILHFTTFLISFIFYCKFFLNPFHPNLYSSTFSIENFVAQ